MKNQKSIGKALFHYMGIYMLIKHNRLTNESSAIDVGLGNTITYTLEYATLFQNLYAFDANIECYNNAIKVAESFDQQNINFYNCFLSNKIENVNFFQNKIDPGHSTRYKNALKNKEHMWTDYDIKQIKSVTLDELLFTKIKNLDFIKIDAECSDVEVILGATNLIKTWRPIIQWEHMYWQGDPPCKNRRLVKEFAKMHNYKFQEYKNEIYFLIP